MHAINDKLGSLHAAAYWWTPKPGSLISHMAGTWSTNPGPHDQWDVTPYYTADQVSTLLAEIERLRRIADSAARSNDA